MINIQEKDLTKLASIHIESKTKYFVQVNSVDALDECVDFANNNILEIVILGKGTNILFTEKEYVNKLFIKLGKAFDYLNIYDDFVEIGGAYSFMRAGKQLTDIGYKDFIYMSLIPGSLGGGVRQNAGTTNEGEIKDNFTSAKIYDLNRKKIIEVNKNDMKFSYRNSILQEETNKFIVLNARFQLGYQESDINKIKSLTQEIKQKKKIKEPSGYCFGSTFKSHLQEKPAWWYIEQVGLKNYIIGGAKFSEIHANWIVNFENANAKDIIDLIDLAKKKVNEKFGIDLVEEVEIV